MIKAWADRIASSRASADPDGGIIRRAIEQGNAAYYADAHQAEARWQDWHENGRCGEPPRSCVKGAITDYEADCVLEEMAEHDAALYRRGAKADRTMMYKAVQGLRGMDANSKAIVLRCMQTTAISEMQSRERCHE